MTPADSLILDAKKAILEEQHRRFRTLQEDGRWQEALQQFQITLSCASDLLNHSLRMLEQIVADQQKNDPRTLPDATPDTLTP